MEKNEGNLLIMLTFILIPFLKALTLRRECKKKTNKMNIDFLASTISKMRLVKLYTRSMKDKVTAHSDLFTKSRE